MTDEAFLIDLIPELRPMYQALFSECAREGIRIKIVQGRRTEAEQLKLYAQGRTAPGPIVTDAKSAKESAHGYGAALDIAIYDGKILSWADKMIPQYDRAGEIGEKVGFRWGGRFPKIDRPHFQLVGWYERFRK